VADCRFYLWQATLNLDESFFHWISLDFICNILFSPKVGVNFHCTRICRTDIFLNQIDRTILVKELSIQSRVGSRLGYAYPASYSTQRSVIEIQEPSTRGMTMLRARLFSGKVLCCVFCGMILNSVLWFNAAQRQMAIVSQNVNELQTF
jgi:hypothetical protein